MWKRNINLLPVAHTSNGDQTLNPGMCPHWELNRQLSLYGMMPSQLSHTGQGSWISFSYLTALHRLASTIISRSGGIGHPCLVPGLRRNHSVFHHVIYIQRKPSTKCERPEKGMVGWGHPERLSEEMSSEQHEVWDCPDIPVLDWPPKRLDSVLLIQCRLCCASPNKLYLPSLPTIPMNEKPGSLQRALCHHRLYLIPHHPRMQGRLGWEGGKTPHCSREESLEQACKTHHGGSETAATVGDSVNCPLLRTWPSFVPSSNNLFTFLMYLSSAG